VQALAADWNKRLASVVKPSEYSRDDVKLAPDLHRGGPAAGVFNVVLEDSGQDQGAMLANTADINQARAWKGTHLPVPRTADHRQEAPRKQKCSRIRPWSWAARRR